MSSYTEASEYNDLRSYLAIIDVVFMSKQIQKLNRHKISWMYHRYLPHVNSFIHLEAVHDVERYEKIDWKWFHWTNVIECDIAPLTKTFEPRITFLLDEVKRIQFLILSYSFT